MPWEACAPLQLGLPAWRPPTLSSQRPPRGGATPGTAEAEESHTELDGGGFHVLLSERLDRAWPEARTWTFWFHESPNAPSFLKPAMK